MQPNGFKMDWSISELIALIDCQTLWFSLMGDKDPNELRGVTF